MGQHSDEPLSNGDFDRSALSRLQTPESDSVIMSTRVSLTTPTEPLTNGDLDRRCPGSSRGLSDYVTDYTPLADRAGCARERRGAAHAVRMSESLSSSTSRRGLSESVTRTHLYSAADSAHVAGVTRIRTAPGRRACATVFAGRPGRRSASKTANSPAAGLHRKLARTANARGIQYIIFFWRQGPANAPIRP